jgi:hypothetical protein
LKWFSRIYRLRKKVDTPSPTAAAATCSTNSSTLQMTNPIPTRKTTAERKTELWMAWRIPIDSCPETPPLEAGSQTFAASITGNSATCQNLSESTPRKGAENAKNSLGFASEALSEPGVFA